MDPGFCLKYNGYEGVADEMCICGREDIAVVVLLVYTWALVDYFYLYILRPKPMPSVLCKIGVEVAFWERLWGLWNDAVRSGP